MEHFAFATLHFGDGKKTATCVLDVCEIARGSQIPQGNRGLPSSDLNDNAGDYRTRRLPRPVGIKRARHHHGKAKGIMEAESYTIGGDFRCAVGRLRL